MFLDLDRHAASDAPALLDEESVAWIGYADLIRRVRAGADALRSLSQLEYGDGKPLVFQFAGNSTAAAICYLAAVEAGAAVALLPSGLPPVRVAHLVALYRPLVVLGNAAPDGYEGWNELPLPGAIRRDRTQPALNADLALLLSTSGSTGSPKLVRLSRAAVEANARSIASALSIDASERAALNLPISYSYGLSVLNSHLLLGASVLLSNQGIMSRIWWDRLTAERATSMPGVPATYEMLHRLGFDTLAPASVVTLTQAGGPLAPHLVRHFHDLMAARRGRFFVMYGQTEATARMAVLDAGKLPEHLGSVGRAIPDGRFDVCPIDGCLSGGEIVYHGPNVMMGYAETPEDLALGDALQGTLRTGDLGVLDGEGFLTITGRLKRMAKISGLRISLDELEAEARHLCPAAAVEARHGVVLFAETDAAGTDALRRRLELHMGLPRTAVRLKPVDALPKTENGKVDYTTLKDWT
ncbi:MAG TPA: AMP-binding protein [Azospirillum sp.]|nr:AMP-binding protein [Azospirillum sp.]